MRLGLKSPEMTDGLFSIRKLLRRVHKIVVKLMIIRSEVLKNITLTRWFILLRISNSINTGSINISCSSLFLQLKNVAEYLNTDTAQVLTPQTKFLPFSFDFKTFLNFQIYSFKTFNLIFCSKNLSASKIPKYL